MCLVKSVLCSSDVQLYHPVSIGETQSKPIRVVLPGGQQQVWRLAIDKDLDRLLNVNEWRRAPGQVQYPPEGLLAVSDLRANAE